jgi:large subunit ribosomal protein L18
MIEGTADKPRISVFRSSKYTYAQVIDDVNGATLASASTKELSGSLSQVQLDGRESKSNKSVNAAYTVGSELAKKLLALGVNQAVFDRSGYRYAGRVKAVAEGARKEGLSI